MSIANTVKYQDDEASLRWRPMVAASVLFHMAMFSWIFFVPPPSSSRPVGGVVYEVNLVEMPAGKKGPQTTKPAAPPEEAKGEVVVKREAPTKRIPSVEKPKKKPLVIAKRTVKKKKPVVKKPRVKTDLEAAISKIQRKVKAKKGDHLNRAISRLEKKAKSTPGAGPGGSGRGGLVGSMMAIYQNQVEEWIKSNWSYPVALREEKDLEATILLTVRRDGSITSSSFINRSSNNVFDASVLKAVQRSDPLPRFPEGYPKSYDEIEIRFNLEELEEQ